MRALVGTHGLELVREERVEARHHLRRGQRVVARDGQLVGLGHDELQEHYGAHIVVPVSWFVRRDGTVHLKWMGTNTTEWFEKQVKALLEE